MKATDQQIIEAVRAAALKNYNEEWGWSVIVECVEDEEIVEMFGGGTVEEALVRAKRFAVEQHDARQEAMSW